jgi:hypothetical protein
MLGGKEGSNLANEGTCIQSIRRAIAKDRRNGWFPRPKR